MMQPLPKLSLAYRLLFQYEKQRQTTSSLGQKAYHNAAESSKESSGGSNNKPARFVLQNGGKKVVIGGAGRIARNWDTWSKHAGNLLVFHLTSRIREKHCSYCSRI